MKCSVIFLGDVPLGEWPLTRSLTLLLQHYLKMPFNGIWRAESSSWISQQPSRTFFSTRVSWPNSLKICHIGCETCQTSVAIVTFPDSRGNGPHCLASCHWPPTGLFPCSNAYQLVEQRLSGMNQMSKIHIIPSTQSRNSSRDVKIISERDNEPWLAGLRRYFQRGRGIHHLWMRRWTSLRKGRARTGRDLCFQRGRDVHRFVWMLFSDGLVLSTLMSQTQCGSYAVWQRQFSTSTTLVQVMN